MATRADLPDLFALAAAPPDGPLRVDPGQSMVEGRRRRRRRAGTALAAALVVVLGVTMPLVTSQHSSSRPATLTAKPPTARAPGGADLASLVAGHWSTLPPAPIPPRQGASTIWTGSELIIWGGESGPNGDVLHDDGAAYNPTTGTWRVLPSSPLSARVGQSAIWTGTEMIVWGGYDVVSATHFHVTADGAAYDPGTNQWQRLPAAPLSPRTYAFAVWTGNELIVLGGQPAVLTDTVRGYPDGAAYNPATERWQPLPVPTPPAGHSLVWSAAVQAGGQLLAWSEWSQTQAAGPSSTSTSAGIDVLAYDEQTAHWRLLPSGALSSPEPDQVLWTGRLVVVRGRPFYCGGCAGPPFDDVTATYDPQTGAWARLPADPLGGSEQRLVSTGTTLISLDTNEINGSTAPGDSSGYDLATRTWARLPSAPYGCGNSAGVLWTGREVLAYCADVGGTTTDAAGLAFTPAEPRAGSTVPARSPAAESALEMCRAGASPDESVEAAHLTTVEEVRDDRGGPGDISPADKPWAQLPGAQPAAWCSFASPSGYVIAAVTSGGPVVGFMVSAQMIDPGSQGPAIP